MTPISDSNAPDGCGLHVPRLVARRPVPGLYQHQRRLPRVLYQDVYNTVRGMGAMMHRVWLSGADGSAPRPLTDNDGHGVGIMGRLVWR